MINNERIVPIQKVDFLSMIGIVLAIANVSFTVLKAKDTTGDFEVTGSGAAGTKLADQPVKTIDFKSGVTSGTVYFVPAFDFDGINVAGSAATIDDSGLDLDDIKADGITLYKAVLGSGEVTLTAVTPMAS